MTISVPSLVLILLLLVACIDCSGNKFSSSSENYKEDGQADYFLPKFPQLVSENAHFRLNSINSILHCLYHLVPFRNLIFSQVGEKKKSSGLRALENIFILMCKNELLDASTFLESTYLAELDHDVLFDPVDFFSWIISQFDTMPLNMFRWHLNQITHLTENPDSSSNESKFVDIISVEFPQCDSIQSYIANFGTLKEIKSFSHVDGDEFVRTSFVSESILYSPEIAVFQIKIAPSSLRIFNVQPQISLNDHSHHLVAVITEGFHCFIRINNSWKYIIDGIFTDADEEDVLAEASKSGHLVFYVESRVMDSTTPITPTSDQIWKSMTNLSLLQLTKTLKSPQSPAKHSVPKYKAMGSNISVDVMYSNSPSKASLHSPCTPSPDSFQFLNQILIPSASKDVQVSWGEVKIPTLDQLPSSRSSNVKSEIPKSGRELRLSDLAESTNQHSSPRLGSKSCSNGDIGLCLSNDYMDECREPILKRFGQKESSQKLRVGLNRRSSRFDSQLLGPNERRANEDEDCNDGEYNESECSTEDEATFHDEGGYFLKVSSNPSSKQAVNSQTGSGHNRYTQFQEDF